MFIFLCYTDQCLIVSKTHISNSISTALNRNMLIACTWMFTDTGQVLYLQVDSTDFKLSN